MIVNPTCAECMMPNGSRKGLEWGTVDELAAGLCSKASELREGTGVGLIGEAQEVHDGMPYGKAA